MWLDWFAPSVLPVLWVAVGTVGMYLAILAMARLAGVRSFAEMSTFDIVVTIALGSLLAGVVATEDPPLLQGLAAAATLYALQLGVSGARKRFRRVEAMVDNAPILLMGAGGELLHANMAIARVTEDDLRSHLRRANVADPADVQAVVMEGTGQISVLHGAKGLDRDAWILKGVRDRTTPEQARRAPRGRPA